MIYDLNRINRMGLDIDEIVSFGDEYLSLSTIKELNDVSVKGRLYEDLSGEIIFEGKIIGIMKLLDYYDNSLIDYPFTIDLNEVVVDNNDFYQEKAVNKQNRLDLKEILWQNIVLEVPIRVTKTKGPNITKGQGWELKDENSKKDDPRLECFKTLLEEGKE